MDLNYDVQKDHRDMDQPDQQQHRQPGVEAEMVPRPQYIDPSYKGSCKLQGKVALITGGDSGTGHAVAVHFATEGADVAINYLADHENEDAEKTLAIVQGQGVKGLAIQGDVGDESFCHYLKTCELCADVCEDCAHICEANARLSKNGMMQECAEACRRCAESCRSMASMAGIQGIH
jgi:NAD(P)-dependent dehydrogenase (short-subunit alcohol dehydrogenase family)